MLTDPFNSTLFIFFFREPRYLPTLLSIQAVSFVLLWLRSRKDCGSPQLYLRINLSLSFSKKKKK